MKIMRRWRRRSRRKKWRRRRRKRRCVMQEMRNAFVLVQFIFRETCATSI
jgi:hypothetical protein